MEKLKISVHKNLKAKKAKNIEEKEKYSLSAVFNEEE